MTSCVQLALDPDPAAVAFAAFSMGVRSIGFTAFAVLGFPAWAYAGWFLMGCPAEDKKEEGYDISEALSGKKKR